MDDYDQGLIQKSELYELIKEDEDAILLASIIDEWSQLLKVIPKTMECIKLLKKNGYQVYILSNTSKEGADTCLALDEAFSLIDGGVYSYEIQINKPDLRIYQCILDKYQLSADECIFIDDKEENIQAARKIGMHGIVCYEVDSCIQQLWKILEESK